MGKFPRVEYDFSTFADFLVEAVSTMYQSPRDRIVELKRLHAFELPRDPLVAGAIWLRLSRLAADARLCKFCCSGTLVDIDGEDYCTHCDAALLRVLPVDKDAKEAVARAL